MTSQNAELVELMNALYSLSDHLEVQRIRQGQDRAHDLAILPPILH